MAKPKKAQIKKKKKQEFEILAPPLFKEKEIGKTMAKDPKQLLGRTVNTNMKDLTGEFSKKYILFKFDVNAVRGGKAHTELKKMEISKSYLSRMVRKGKSKLDKITDHKTTDDKYVRVKTIIITKGKITTKQKKGLHHTTMKNMEKQLEGKSLESMANSILNQSVPNTLKKTLKKTFPISYVAVRMLEVITPKKFKKKAKEPVITLAEPEKEEPKEEALKPKTEPKPGKKKTVEPKKAGTKKPKTEKKTIKKTAPKKPAEKKPAKK